MNDGSPAQRAGEIVTVTENQAGGWGHRGGEGGEAETRAYGGGVLPGG